MDSVWAEYSTVPIYFFSPITSWNRQQKVQLHHLFDNCWGLFCRMLCMFKDTVPHCVPRQSGHLIPMTKPHSHWIVWWWWWWRRRASLDTAGFTFSTVPWSENRRWWQWRILQQLLWGPETLLWCHSSCKYKKEINRCQHRLLQFFWKTTLQTFSVAKSERTEANLDIVPVMYDMASVYEEKDSVDQSDYK